MTTRVRNSCRVVDIDVRHSSFQPSAPPPSPPPARLCLRVGQGAPEESAEEAAAEADLLNSLREYDLRTDKCKTSKAGEADPYRSSSVAVRLSSDADTCSSSSSSSSAAAAARLATSGDGTPEGLTPSSEATIQPGGEGREEVDGGGVVSVNGGGRRDKDGAKLSAGKRCDSNGGSDVMGKISNIRVETGFGVGGRKGGSVPSGDRKKLGPQEAKEQAAPTASATYRRQEASAAVGACLVTSSVRKDGKVCFVVSCK